MAEVSCLRLREADEDDDRTDDVVAIDSVPYWSSDVDNFDALASDSEPPPSDLSASITAVHGKERDRTPDIDDVMELDSIMTVDPFDRENQASFIMDLLHQRVEQSSVGDDAVSVSPDPSSGVIEWNDGSGSGQFRLDLGLGLGFCIDLHGWDDHNDNDDHNNCGFMVADCGDEFYVSRRVSPESSASHGGGDRFSGVSRSGENEAVETTPIEVDEDFEWEQVDARVDEREVESVFFDADVDEELVASVSTAIPSSEEMGVNGVPATRNLEWEILLNIREYEAEQDLMNEDLSRDRELHHDDSPLEYEVMRFGQFTEIEAAIVGKPPASRTVIESLNSVVLSEEDVDSCNVVCAVCKDGMNVGEEAKELPCAHRYHGECIVPWLGIRNTCPVCRFELPTDDPEYESWRAQRGGHVHRRGIQ
ncbi:Ubiquitin--protein ligase [Bertholletia excelsa]